MSPDELDVRLKMLRMVAPGSELREGLESILRARSGALIVVGDSPEVQAITDGGFRLDVPFAPSYLYELAKMDGAIILSRDAHRILWANTLLVPQPAIPSFETGIRHRTAERVAKQTGELVIAISQRRNVISLYKGAAKYVLQETPHILAKANEALAALARHRQRLEEALRQLSLLELEQEVTVGDVVSVLARAALVDRIVREVEADVVELGAEGRLVAMQLREMSAEVDIPLLVLKDYLEESMLPRAAEVRQQFREWEGESLDPASIARSMGLPASLDTRLRPRGYRLLSRVPRLPSPVVDNIVAAFGSLDRLQEATVEELDAVEGIGEVRARAIRESLLRLRAEASAEVRL